MVASRLETDTAIDSRAKRNATALDKPRGPKSDDEQRQARDPKPVDGPTVHIAIENDREFGPIVTLSTAAAHGRIVRALPASIDHLRDAVRELAAVDVRLADATELILGSLCALVESTPPGAEAHIDLQS